MLANYLNIKEKRFIGKLVILIFITIIFLKYFRSNNSVNPSEIESNQLESGLSSEIRSKRGRIKNEEESRQCNFENYVLGQPVKQDDPCLISTVRKKLLIPPPSRDELNTRPYNSTGELPSNLEKFKWIEKLLIENNNPAEGTPGFFIECGANDGEFISATLRIEKTYKWKGLLIEGNSVPFQKLLKLKRNAWAINAAACVSDHPKPVTFWANTDPFWSGLSGLKYIKEKSVVHGSIVQCIPLYTMIKAIGVETVDFLNLDVEGAELQVLRTIPFEKVKFKVMAVEYDHVPGKQKALINFLRPKGYRFVKELRDHLTFDCLFVHESLYELAVKIKNDI